LFEAICNEFARDWAAGRRPAIETRLRDSSGDYQSVLVAKLIRIELEWRCRRGESPSAPEYTSRFPSCSESICEMLEFAGKRSGSSSVDMTSETLDDGRDSQPPPEGGGPSATEQPHRVVGDYELFERLGAGGMGEVFRARHRRLDKAVALKLVRPCHEEHASRVARFLREMKMIGRIDHPNVVEAFDAGEEEGVVYLAMKLIDGEDFEHLVRRRGPLSVAEACGLAHQAARGLEYLHGLGLVHRDLKPSNFMRASDGVVKILDLGLAREQAATAGADNLTADGTMLGTPDYGAPEQFGSLGKVDGRADFYGLGGTLFFLLTGRPPFAHRKTLYEKLDAHAREEVPKLTALRPTVPADLCDFVRRLLAKQPADRPQSCAEIVESLSKFCEGSNPGGGGSPHEVRRRPSAVIRAALRIAAGLVGVCALTTLAVSYLYNGFDSTRTKEQELSASLSTPALGISTHVFRLDPAHGPPQELGGALTHVGLNDLVLVEAKLSEPAYAYLIAFNPTDDAEKAEQYVPAKRRDVAPPMSDQLPQLGAITLNDGIGLQAFVVVASRRPLPPYAQWRQKRPRLPWGLVSRTTPGAVWLGDGNLVNLMFPIERPRAIENAADDREMIEALGGAVKALPDVDAVSVIGFAVDPPDLN
jgi:serine/threonine protein kinase